MTVPACALRRAAEAAAVITYGAAVAYLTWATVANHLGDQPYRKLVMLFLGFPMSLVDLLVGSRAFNALRGERLDPSISAWDYLQLAWPGIAMTIVLAVLLRSRYQRTGRSIGWFLAGMTLFSALSTVFDGWAPRRPWGWPLLALGIVMTAGLWLSRRQLTCSTADWRTRR